MSIPKDYREQYSALPYKRKQMVLALLKKWADWSDTTVRRKLAGESVTPIERILLEGVLSFSGRPDAEQLEIQFDWDGVQEAIVMKIIRDK